MMSAVTAVLVTQLGGTPEEADRVWARVRNLPVTTPPSHFIQYVSDALKEARA